MAQKDAFLSDLQLEAVKTRKMLERVPMEHADYKPHEKSSSLWSMARHLANLYSWTAGTLLADEMDFAKPMEPVPAISTKEELLALFDRRTAEAIEVVSNTTDEVLDSDWTMRMGEQIFFTRPKKEVLREFVLSHGIHHRAQLTIYFRLLDVPVPSIYGPSADER
jgi:uncharacterized damage-inducible protein DinB